MMSLLWRCRRHPVGVDIQPDGIRIARFGRLGRSGFRLDCVDRRCLAIPPSVSRSKMDWAALGDLMNQMVKAHRLQGQPAVVSLPASAVKMQRVQFSGELQTYAVEAAIQGRLRHEIPGLTEMVCVDYLTMPSAGGKEKEVYYAAARQALLAQYVDCAASAGLEVKIVDVDVCALRRTFSHAAGISCAENTVHAVFVEIKEMTEFIVYNHQVILFHQFEKTSHQQSVAAILARQQRQFHTLFPHLRIQFIIVSCSSMDHATKQDENEPLMRFVEPYAFLGLTPQTQAVIREHSEEYLVACGLAMRELPAWC